MRRFSRILLFLVLPLAFGSSSASAFGIPSDSRPVAAFDASELVRKLGDAQFSVRKRAMAHLVELGIDAMPALEKGVQSKDREISYRSQLALKVVRARDFQRRLRAFATGQDANESYQLAGWGLFRKEVGGGSEARALFVEMQEAERVLLEAVEKNPDKAADALLARLETLKAKNQVSFSTNQVSLGTVATILFILNQKHMQLPRTTFPVSFYFRNSSFVSALQNGSQRDVLRKMFGAWIARAENSDIFDATYLSLQYGIPQGLVPARKLLERPDRERNRMYYYSFALLLFAKFGNESDIPFLETYLKDATPLSNSVPLAGKAKFRPQIRDVALATIIRLAKQDHKQFGFDRLAGDSAMVFNTNSLAFEDDAKRDEAIKKWTAFWTRRPGS